MPTAWDPYEYDDIRKIDAQRRETAAYQPNAGLASNLNSLSKDYPWMPPGVVWGLANAGITGEAANPIAQESAKQSLKTGRTKRAGKREADRRLREWEEGLESGGLVGNFNPLKEGIGAAGDALSFAWNEQKKNAGAQLPNTPGATAGLAVRKGENLIDTQAAQRTQRGESVATGIQPIVQGAAIAAQYPADLTAAALREEFAHPLGIGRSDEDNSFAHLNKQTLAYQAWAKGRPVGEGLLPSYEQKIDGETSAAGAAAEHARDASPYLVGGHAWTPGRALGQGVGLDADTVPFNLVSGLVDAAVAIKVDPAASALGALGKANRARRTFEVLPDAAAALRTNVDELAEAGARVAHRPWIKGQHPVQWLQSPKGSQVVDALAASESSWEIWNALGRKAPTDLVAQLRFATSPEDVRGVLAPHLGTTLEQVPKWRGGVNVKPRYSSSIPTSNIGHLDDPDRFVLELDSHLVNSRVPVEQRAAVFNRYVEANGRGERYAAVDASFDAMKQQMIAHGIPEERAQDLTRFSRTKYDESKFWIDHATGDSVADMPFVKIGDDMKPIPTRHASAEMLSSTIQFPDQKEMRRLTSSLNGLYDTDAWQAGVHVGDAVMGVWKTSVLLRGAWTLRVIGDEMARMSVVGTSLFRSPLSHIAWMVGSPQDSKFAAMLDKINVRQLGRGRTDVTAAPIGSELEDPFNEALTEAFGAIKPTRKVRLPHYSIVGRGDPAWAKGMTSELSMLHASPEFKAATTLGPEDFKTWLWSGEGKYWRYQIAEEAKTEVLAQPDLFSSGRYDYSQMYGEGTGARTASDAYADSVHRRIMDLTRGDGTLVNAIRTGKIGDHALTDAWKEPNPAVLETLDQLRQAGAGGEYVKIQSWMSAGESAKEKGADASRKIVGSLFDGLMTKPSNYLSRSPRFRQTYWDEVETLAPTLTPKAREELVTNMRYANLSGAQEKRIVDAVANPTPGTMALDAVDQLAKKRSLDDVRFLLYDLHEKSQFFEASRLIFPFGEAWKEVLTRWANLAAEYPQVARRAQQGIQSARQSGFFRTDPQTGEEVFTYPGSEWMTEKLMGVPIPLKGAVRGLNMVGTGMPGIGPAVSVPISALLPNKPQYDTIREFLFPYGEPEGSTQDRLFRAFAPSWVQKVSTGLSADPDDDRLFGNTVFDMVRYLNSTGEYDLEGDDAHDEMRRLWSDATSKARTFYVIRGLAQSISPSAPMPDWQVEDKSGRLYLAQKLADEYSKKVEKVGTYEATEWFIDRYGPDAIFTLQSKSERNVEGLTDESKEIGWERANSEIVGKYPQTWALFAPNGGKFDIGAYTDDFTQGQRDALSPEEMTKRANSRLAAHVLEREKRRLAADGMSKQDDARLSEFKAQLTKDFPGYNESGFDYQKTATLVEELGRAAGDPELRKTGAGKALVEYFKIREAAMASGVRGGLKPASVFTAKKGANVREWMRSEVDTLIREHPRFRDMWDQVLSRELSD